MAETTFEDMKLALGEERIAKLRQIIGKEEEIVDETEEATEYVKEKAPEDQRKVATIEELQEKVAVHEKTIAQLLDAISAPDLSNVDLPPEEKHPGYIEHQFTCFDEFALDLFKEGPASRDASDKMVNWRRRTKEIQKATMTAGDAEVGGTLIPVEFASELLDRVKRINPILSRAQIIPMQTNKIDIPYLESFDESQGKVVGAVAWYWEGEEDQFTGSNIETGAVELVLRKCSGLARVSRDLLKYSPQSVIAILRRAFDYGMNRTINKVALRGTGAGQPLGVIGASGACLDVAKATGQTADTYIYDNILDMVARLYVADDDLAPAVWLANRTVLPQVGKLSVAVGTGGSGIFLVNSQIQNAPNYSLMGIPLQWSSLCSAVGDSGDVVLGDWSQYLVGQPAGSPGAEFAQSMHLYFDYASMAYRFIFDMDGKPWWPEEYRPEYGDSQAPFVTCADRA